jgi:hypothetical protein
MSEKVTIRRINSAAWDSLPHALRVAGTKTFRASALEMETLAQYTLERIHHYIASDPPRQPRYEVSGRAKQVRGVVTGLKVRKIMPKPKGQGIERLFTIYRTGFTSAKATKTTVTMSGDELTRQGPFFDNKQTGAPSPGSDVGFTIQPRAFGRPRLLTVLRVLNNGYARDHVMWPHGKALRFFDGRGVSSRSMKHALSVRGEASGATGQLVKYRPYMIRKASSGQRRMFIERAYADMKTKMLANGRKGLQAMVRYIASSHSDRFSTWRTSTNTVTTRSPAVRNPMSSLVPPMGVSPTRPNNQ